MSNRDPKRCQIYGCGRDRKLDASVTMDILEETRTLQVCDYHEEIFLTMNPAWYEVGFTYKNDVEFRLIPVQPAPIVNA